MSDIAIQVRDISKQYQIGTAAPKYRTFRDTLTDAVLGPFRKTRGLFIGQANSAAGLKETIWALKDISFDIKEGEVVGIIGRNGAGKSTLLKILSRITEPTTGEARFKGRLGSLLEVGTGFHPELTGRENIYLNGAILGMTRAEINRKFDEIVDFSGVEQFLDTPVKHYSSGMYVRLAFAVAAHLEPEILVVDEVLSVGDAAFQKKSMGKMGEVAKSGRTVLFVSHNMAAVENLCDRGIVLDRGQVKFIGSQTAAIEEYLSSLDVVSSGSSLRHRQDRIGNGILRFVNLSFHALDGTELTVAKSGQDVEIRMHFETREPVVNRTVYVGLRVFTNLGIPVFSQTNRMTQTTWKNLPESGFFACKIPRLPLPPSTYSIAINAKVDEEYADAFDVAGHLTVIEGDFFETGRTPSISVGVALVDGEWELRPSAKQMWS